MNRSISNVGLTFIALQTIALALRFLGIVSWPWPWVFLPFVVALLFIGIIALISGIYVAYRIFGPQRKIPKR